MLQYIYINKRVLEKIKADQATEAKLIELEDALLKIGEDHTRNPELNSNVEVVELIEVTEDKEDKEEA
jgi:hypothetical protein